MAEYSLHLEQRIIEKWRIFIRQMAEVAVTAARGVNRLRWRLQRSELYRYKEFMLFLAECIFIDLCQKASRKRQRAMTAAVSLRFAQPCIIVEVAA